MNNKDDPYTLIIGSSNMDLNIYSERLPQQGETVTGGIFKQFLGGKGANQAVAAVRSGSNTKFIGKIGNDLFGEQMIAQLSTAEGIDTSRITTDPKNASGVAFILIDNNGENMISVAPGANSKLYPAEIRKNSDVIRNAGSIAVQMEIPMDTISEIYKIASEGNAIKILNPAPLRSIPLEILANIDILVPNKGELFQMYSIFNLGELDGTDDEKIIEASEKLSNLGIGTIITTLGPKGCILYQKNDNKNTVIKFPAFKVKAIDTVGAGDCFIGVLAGKIAKNKTNIVDAVSYAISAASIAVTRKGAQASMPYIDEIEARFEEYRKMMKHGEKIKN
jgi:ribokinase